MIGSDKIAVITASYGLIEKLHFLTDSARRFGIDVKIWGQHPWRGWFHSHLDSLIELKRLRGEGFTHFLYTDGIDCFFLAGLSEILSKYEQMGEPSWLISGEMNCWPLSELAGAPVFSCSSPYKYPNGGGNMGEIDYVLTSWELLKQLYQHRSASLIQSDDLLFLTVRI